MTGKSSESPSRSRSGLFELVFSDDIECYRCSYTLICSVQVPHSFLRRDGVEVWGSRTIVLCPNCDGADPLARAVIDSFTRHRDRTDLSLPDFVVVLGDWLSEFLPARVDETQLALLLSQTRVRSDALLGLSKDSVTEEL